MDNNCEELKYLPEGYEHLVFLHGDVFRRKSHEYRGDEVAQCNCNG